MTGEPPSRAKLRRYTWCRLSNDFPDLPIWRAVARRAKVPVSLVVAVAVRLECLANRSVPRGVVADFSDVEFAASLDARPNAIARIRTALQSPDIGWVDQDHVVSFHERNPDSHDPTALVRQRRRRARLKQERERSKTFSGAEVPEDNPTKPVTRDTVTVTPRSEQSKEEERGLARAGVGEGVAVPETTSDTTVWLAMEGKRIVAERCRVMPSRAWMDIRRWGKELGDDTATLAQLIADADHLGLERGRFTDRIRDQIIRYRYEAKGPPLPLPLSIAKRPGAK